MSASRHLQQYRRANVSTADPVELLLMLIDEAVRSAERARLEQDDLERRRLLGRSLAIMAELIGSLEVDVGGEGAWNMLRLYLFINGRLAEAIRGDQARLPEALRILRHVRETWHEAAQIARAGR
jgi:flagellar protein FliS